MQKEKQEMLRYTILALICLAGPTNSALGDVYVWTENAEDCTIDHEDNTIQINEAGTYGFRAWDGSSELEEIRSITVDSGVTGDVTVTIAWDQYGGNGAADLWTGDLTHATYAVYLAGLEISGSIATTDDFICDNITGTVDIDGDVVGEVTTTSWSSTSSLLVVGGAARMGLMVRMLRHGACPRVSVLG
jgi:hypothetical protein